MLTVFLKEGNTELVVLSVCVMGECVRIVFYKYTSGLCHLESMGNSFCNWQHSWSSTNVPR